MKKYLKSIFIYLSRRPVVRYLFPIFNDYYLGTFQNDKTRLAIFNNKYFVLMRTVNFWKYAPLKYNGGLILNLLGFQVFRYVVFNLRYILRATPENNLDIYQQARSNGCLVVPDFLSADKVAYLKDFCQKNVADSQDYFKDFSELVICDNNGLAKKIPEYQELFNKIKEWTHYEQLAATLTKRELQIVPHIAFLKYKSKIGAEFEKQVDGQDTPHVDVFYPSYKLFVYLNDVPVEGGPLNYFKRSHRFSLRNALTEYVASIYYYLIGKNKLSPVDHTKFRFDKNYERTPLVGEAGSGVIFNVQGIHCRGSFKKDIPRERLVLLIDFRQAECLTQKYAA